MPDLTGKITPKPPVRWVVTIEMSEQERAAWTAFLYRLRDGQVVHGLTGETAATFNNTASSMHHLFDEGYTE